MCRSGLLKNQVRSPELLFELLVLIGYLKNLNLVVHLNSHGACGMCNRPPIPPIPYT